MIPATALCRCGQPVAIRGGLSTHTLFRGVERMVWFAGGECLACGRIVQYGYGGDALSYRHGRWWYIGRHAESAPGVVRRWPAEWGFAEHADASVQ